MRITHFQSRKVITGQEFLYPWQERWVNRCNSCLRGQHSNRVKPEHCPRQTQSSPSAFCKLRHQKHYQSNGPNQHKDPFRTMDRVARLVKITFVSELDKGKTKYRVRITTNPAVNNLHNRNKIKQRKLSLNQNTHLNNGISPS